MPKEYTFSVTQMMQPIPHKRIDFTTSDSTRHDYLTIPDSWNLGTLFASFIAIEANRSWPQRPTQFCIPHWSCEKLEKFFRELDLTDPWEGKPPPPLIGKTKKSPDAAGQAFPPGKMIWVAQDIHMKCAVINDGVRCEFDCEGPYDTVMKAYAVWKEVKS